MCETHTQQCTQCSSAPPYSREALRGSFCCTSEIEMSEAQQSSLIATQPTEPFSSAPFLLYVPFTFIYLAYSHNTHSAKSLQQWVLPLTVYIHSKCVVVRWYGAVFAVKLLKPLCYYSLHWATGLPSFGLITAETLGFRLVGESHYFTLKQRLIECFQTKGNYLFASQRRSCMLPASSALPSSGDLLSWEKPSHKTVFANYVAEQQLFNKMPMTTIPPVVVK